MNRKESIKILSLFFLFISSLYITLANFYHSSQNNDNSIINKIISFGPKIVYGIDIQGGMQMVLEPDFSDFAEQKYLNITEEMKDKFWNSKIKYKIINVDTNGILINLKNSQDLNLIKEIFYNLDKNLYLNYHKENKDLFIFYKNQAKENIKSEIINNIIPIIKNRIDFTGVQEINLIRYGVDKIIISIPKNENMNNIKNMILKTAKLSFHQVYREKTKNALILKDFKNSKIEYFLSKNVLLSGSTIIDSKAINDGISNNVQFRLNTDGAIKFAKITSENVGFPIAIVIDNKVISVPIVRDKILTGSGVISGNFTYQEAEELALLLKAGALDVPLKITEEKIIHNSLDKSVIKSIQIGFMVSMFLIFSFMLMRYATMGLITIFVLIFNLLITISIIALFRFTLSLPGIAGMILTISMAVDANVLIYEKIREMKKLNLNISKKRFLEQAFSGAWSSIFDSNITTIIACISLLIFGSSFLKGFAIVLIFGILSSIFTSVFVTKILLFQLSEKRIVL